MIADSSFYFGVICGFWIGVFYMTLAYYQGRGCFYSEHKSKGVK